MLKGPLEIIRDDPCWCSQITMTSTKELAIHLESNNIKVSPYYNAIQENIMILMLY